MKNLILLAAASFLLVSCKSIDGVLDVQKSFEAVVNKKCGWNPFASCDPTKKIEIPVGNYKSTVEFSSKTEIKIDLKSNLFKESIILKRPKNFDFPANGTFRLTKEQVGQSFDVVGQVSTQVWNSPPQQNQESCTYSIRDWVCYPNGNNRPQCGWQDRTVWGYRFVEYYLRNTTQVLNSDLVQGSDSLARFVGERTDSEKIYRYTGICR